MPLWRPGMPSFPSTASRTTKVTARPSTWLRSNGGAPRPYTGSASSRFETGASTRLVTSLGQAIPSPNPSPNPFPNPFPNKANCSHVPDAGTGFHASFLAGLTEWQPFHPNSTPAPSVLRDFYLRDWPLSGRFPLGRHLEPELLLRMDPRAAERLGRPLLSRRHHWA